MYMLNKLATDVSRSCILLISQTTSMQVHKHLSSLLM
uniref:Uncharacterized protein n=1 Tax=Arundo donax TaxID=35708 RepID=A0A0A9EN07_ARUDO